MRISACRVSVRIPFSTSWLAEAVGFSDRAPPGSTTRLALGRDEPLDATLDCRGPWRGTVRLRLALLHLLSAAVLPLGGRPERGRSFRVPERRGCAFACSARSSPAAFSISAECELGAIPIAALLAVSVSSLIMAANFFFRSMKPSSTELRGTSLVGEKVVKGDLVRRQC